MRRLLAGIAAGALASIPAAADAETYGIRTTNRQVMLEVRIAEVYMTSDKLVIGIGEMSKAKRGGAPGASAAGDMGAAASGGDKVIRDNDFGEMTYDAKSDTIRFCDHVKRQTFVMDEGTGERMKAALANSQSALGAQTNMGGNRPIGSVPNMAGNRNLPNVDKIIEDAVKNAPEGQKEMVRAQMLQMFGGFSGEKQALLGPSGAGKTTTINAFERIYKPTGKRTTKNGYSVAVYDIFEGDARIGRFYGANPRDVPGGARLKAHFEAISKLVSAITKELRGAGASAAIMKSPDGLAFIGEEKLDANGAIIRETWLESASSKAAPAKAFAGCPTYAEQNMMGGM